MELGVNHRRPVVEQPVAQELLVGTLHLHDDLPSVGGMAEHVHNDLLVVTLPEVDFVGVIVDVDDFFRQDVVEEEHQVPLVVPEDVLECPVGEEVDVGAGCDTEDEVLFLLLGEHAEAVVFTDDSFVLSKLLRGDGRRFHSSKFSAKL